MLCEDEQEPEQVICRCRNCVLRNPEDVPWPEALELEAETQTESVAAQKPEAQKKGKKQKQKAPKAPKAQKAQKAQKGQKEEPQPTAQEEEPTEMEKHEEKKFGRRGSVRTIESLHSNATMLEADRDLDFQNGERLSGNVSATDARSATQQQPQQPTILLIVVNKPPENPLYPPPGAPGYGPGPARGPHNYYNPPPGPGFGHGRGPPGYGPGRGPPGYGPGRGGPGYGPGPSYGQYPGYGPGPNYGPERRRNDGYRENRPYPQRRGGDPRERRDSYQNDGRQRQPPASQNWRGGPPPQGGKNSGGPRRSNDGEDERDDDGEQPSRCRCGQADGRKRGKAGNAGNTGNGRDQNNKRCMCVSEDGRYTQSNPPSHRNCHCHDNGDDAATTTKDDKTQGYQRDGNEREGNERGGTTRSGNKRVKNNRGANRIADEPESPENPENPRLPFSKETTCSHQKEEVIIPGQKTYRYVTVPVCITHGNAKSCVCCDCRDEPDDDDDDDEDEDNPNRVCDCSPKGHCTCMDGHGGSHLPNELLCECDMTNLERTLQHLIPNTDCMCYFKSKKKRRKRKPIPFKRYDRFASPPFVLNPRPRCLEYSCNSCCCPVGRSCYSHDFSHACCRPCCW